jgi:large subunit ribosomal protein L15
MKIFDWKRREADESSINDMENFVLTINNIRPAPGAYHRKKRKGRGIAAGQGASCGFGMRGQKSRSGRSVRPGFEGGQTPLYRRLPKWPGRTMGPGHKRVVYNLIKLDELNLCDDGDVVNFATLFNDGYVTKAKPKLPHKVVQGRTPFKVSNLTVQAHAFTNGARAAIEELGGTCEVLSKTTGKVVVEGEIDYRRDENGKFRKRGWTPEDDVRKEEEKIKLKEEGKGKVKVGGEEGEGKVSKDEEEGTED